MVRLRLALVAVALAAGLATAQDDPARAEVEARVQRLIDETSQLFKEGKYAEARTRAEEAVAEAEKELGPEDRLTAASLGWLGGARKALGELAGAKSADERALAICEKAYGPDDPETARALNNLAIVLRAMGDLAGARPLYERSLAIREKALGPDDPATAMAVSNLGTLLFQLGDYDEAQRSFERALAVQEKALGPEDTAVAITLDNLSSVVRAKGDLLGAKALSERVLAIHERSLGPDHPETATSVNGLAVLLQELGDLEAARPLHERAKATWEKALGPDHPNVALSLTNLGYIARTRGDLDAARPLYERALWIREKALGRDHTETADSLNNLASLLVQHGDRLGARRLHERAVRIHEKAYGLDHPRTSISLVHLAGDAEAMGDLDLARSLYERALKIQEAKLGEDHPQVAWTLGEMSHVFRARGELDRAGECLKRAVGILERKFGPEHRDIAALLVEQSVLRRLEGDPEGRKRLLVRALSIRQKTLGPDHPSTVSSMSNLAVAMWETGEREAAAPLLDSAWDADIRFIRSLLCALSSRDRQGFLRDRASHLGGYLHVRAGDPEKAWSAALAWKGAALRASAMTLRSPPGATEEEGRLSESLYLARRALATFVLSPPRARAGGPSVVEQSETLRNRVEDLERSLAKTRPDLAEAMLAGAAPRDVLLALPEGTVLLDLLENQGVLHAWVARRDRGVEYFCLGDGSDLGPLTLRFRDALGCDDQAAWKEAGDALYGRLEKPLAAALDGARALCVSPDGALATIPWGLLPEGEGILVERLPVVCVNGGASLAVGAQSRHERSGSGLLALGGVDYSGLDRQFPSLAGTKGEVELVAERFHGAFEDAPRRVVTGKDGEEGAFRREAPKAGYVHVATHGFFDIENLRGAVGAATRGLSGKATSPLDAAREQGLDLAGWNPLLLSGLVLAPSKDGDGYLTAEELQDLDLRGVELVVLSACETGRGELAAGEGVLGLSRALAIAGARQFMLSLWRVPDAETSELMDAFYKGLWEDGLPAEEALRRAQLAMLARDREKGVFRPSTWGAWVLTR